MPERALAARRFAIWLNELHRAHAPLRVTDGAFEEMLKLLGKTLQEYDLGAEDVSFVCSAVTAGKPYIVAGASASGA